MKCDSCQEKATVFYTQVTNGKLKKFVLCETCAESKGITSPEGLLMPGEILGGPTTPVVTGEAATQTSQEECSGCGFTLETFRKVGRLGCPQCYQAFAMEIGQRLPSMHKGAEHVGYLPEGLAKQHALESELTEMASKLANAIEEERYEEAASLRDRIQELETNQKGVATS